MVHDVPCILCWSQRFHHRSKTGRTSTAVTRSRRMRLHRAHGVLRLALEHGDDLAAVGARAVQHEEVGEPGHGDAEERVRFAGPVLVERPAVAADDLQAGEVVRGLEPGRHHEDVDLALDAVDVDDPGGGHRRHGRGDELDVGLLERGIERGREDRPLPRVRVAAA